jgi:hypothetical protein
MHHAYGKSLCTITLPIINNYPPYYKGSWQYLNITQFFLIPRKKFLLVFMGKIIPRNKVSKLETNVSYNYDLLIF